VLENEIQKWRGFVKALRVDDQAIFDELMNICRHYASAAGAATRPIVLEAMIMVILLSHQKILREIEDTLEKLKAAV
jgi:hypothetical protein